MQTNQNAKANYKWNQNSISLNAPKLACKKIGIYTFVHTNIQGTYAPKVNLGTKLLFL